MSYEEKDGDFVLFKNNKKKSEKSPDFTGTINKDGKKFNFSMWEKTSKNGNQFYSGKIGDVYQPPQSNAKPAYEAQRQQSKPLAEDEIPW